MRDRISLDNILRECLGSTYVYYNPPENIKMHYPCIVYDRDDSYTSRADDTLYYKMKRYRITVIDRDPDSEIPDIIEELPYCNFNRSYKADGLCHFVFTLYY